MSEAPTPQRNMLLESKAQQSVGEYISGYVRRIRSGDLGPLPIIIGLVFIAIFFQLQNSNYLTPRNFVNLILQMSGLTMIAYGMVFVLLLGEIDLSAGYVSGIAGVLITVLIRPPYEFSWPIVVIIALAVVTFIGFIQGSLITSFQLPSFIVTLAGLLAWNGFIILIVGQGGTIRIEAPELRDLASTYLPKDSIISWVIALVLLVGYVAVQFSTYNTRRAQGLGTTPLPIVFVQTAGLAVFLLGAVYVCNLDRGVPLVGVFILLMLVILTFVATSTRFGRYVFAVGGNKEAARRAGIRVERIRLYVFMLMSFMAGIGGIVLASRLQSVAPNQGGGNLLLNVIAAAVIGGTSLFGGRGSVSSALLGALIIAGVENGMNLLGLQAAIQFIITGGVLLLAVIVDAISRRSQKRSGIG